MLWNRKLYIDGCHHEKLGLTDNTYYIFLTEHTLTHLTKQNHRKTKKQLNVCSSDFWNFGFHAQHVQIL